MARSVAGMTVSVTKSLVRVLTGAGMPVGSGCHLGDGYVLTAAHVVAAALGLPHGPPPAEIPKGEVELNFPWATDKQTVRARTLGWGPDPAHHDVHPAAVDLAVLRLDDATPTGAGIAPVRAFLGAWDREVWVWGFPASDDRGRRLVCKASAGQGSLTVQLDGDREQTYWIEPGFSGGIAWERQVGWAVGVVVTTSARPAEHVGHMIPLGVVRDLWHDVWVAARAAEDAAEDPCRAALLELTGRLERFDDGLRAQALRSLPPHEHDDEDYAAATFAERLLGAGLVAIGRAVQTLAIGAHPRVSVEEARLLYTKAAPFAIVDAVAAADTRAGIVAEPGDRARLSPGVQLRATGQVVLDRASVGLEDPLKVCFVGAPDGVDQQNGFAGKVRAALLRSYHCENQPGRLPGRLRLHPAAVIVAPPAPDDLVIDLITDAYPDVFFLFLSDNPDDRERGAVDPLPEPVLSGDDEDELMSEYEFMLAELGGEVGW